MLRENIKINPIALPILIRSFKLIANFSGFSFCV